MLDERTFLVILHIFGVALGAGGAYVTDLIFITSVRDERFSRTELRFLRLGSRVIWFGVLLLVLSGVGLYLLAPDHYASSPKFLTKITIVGAIVLNGVLMHFWHFPKLLRHMNEHFPSSDEFVRHRPFLLASAAISGVSWTSAVILGVMPSIPVGYAAAIGIWLAVVLAVGASLIFLRDAVLPHHGRLSRLARRIRSLIAEK